MPKFSAGVWVSRELLRALDGDGEAAILFRQAAWIQDQFDGAWSATAGWWSRMFGFKEKAIRAAFRRLEDRGWVSIERRGRDPRWWIQVDYVRADYDIRAAQRALPKAPMWEIKGRRNPSEFADSQSGTGVPVTARGSSQKGKGVFPKRNPHHLVLDDELEVTTGVPSLQPFQEHASRKNTRDEAPPGEHVERNQPGRPSEPFDAFTAMQGLSLGEILASRYPHPANGAGQIRRPSGIQVEAWLLELVRLGKAELDPETNRAIMTAVEREVQFARKNPESYRRTLRNWLRQLAWQEKLDKAPDETPRGARKEKAAPLDNRAEWDRLEQRGRGA